MPSIVERPRLIYAGEDSCANLENWRQSLKTVTRERCARYERVIVQVNLSESRERHAGPTVHGEVVERREGRRGASIPGWVSRKVRI